MPQPIWGRRFLTILSALVAFGAAAVATPPQGRAAGADGYGDSSQDNTYPSEDTARPQPPYRPSGVYREDDNYRTYDDRPVVSPRPRPPEDSAGYGEPYHPPGEPYDGPPPPDDRHARDSFSENEILEAGRRFFGSVSQGLASVVEYAFSKSGRPNGYILGEDAGGAFIAGLRYGEGTLYTKDAGAHKVYWQGPSIGYDFGGEGSKTMVLVYNLREPWQIYNRYAGVQGSAYFVGGVGIQFQTHGNVTLAPIRAGVGLRLGANVGYLKYTRTPTWNPF